MNLIQGIHPLSSGGDGRGENEGGKGQTGEGDVARGEGRGERDEREGEKEGLEKCRVDNLAVVRRRRRRPAPKTFLRLVSKAKERD